MTIVVISPNLDEVKKIQNAEVAFYWSKCIEAILRRGGFINTLTLAEHVNNLSEKSLSIFARGTNANEWRPGTVLEGPRPDRELVTHDIEFEYREAKTIYLKDKEKNSLGSLAYQAVVVRHIPENQETSNPFLNQPEDQRWSNQKIRLQFFKTFPGWEPILFANFGYGDEVVGLYKKGVALLGIPLGDLIAAGYAFPPLVAGYYQMAETPPNGVIEKKFLEIVARVASDVGYSISMAEPWPYKKRFALTIRHDCDRPITFLQMLDLLLFYFWHGVRASFGILRCKMPRSQIFLIKLFGHEINLHSESASETQLCEERAQLQALARVNVDGFHSHGGRGSKGYLGDYHFEWGGKLKFEYVEMLGRSTRQPHAVNRVVEGIPVTTSLIAPAVHTSLDAGMRPEQHFLDDLSKELESIKAKKEHMVIMNHPDIHIHELKTFIRTNDFSEAWHATLSDVCKWFRRTRM